MPQRVTETRSKTTVKSGSDTRSLKPREIRFFIRMPDGQHHVCRMAGDAKIATVLAKQGLSGSVLSHQGKMLEKSATLIEYRIRDNQCLQVAEPLVGGSTNDPDARMYSTAQPKPKAVAPLTDLGLENYQTNRPKRQMQRLSLPGGSEAPDKGMALAPRSSESDDAIQEEMDRNELLELLKKSQFFQKLSPFV